jgi:hypothetical protein
LGDVAVRFLHIVVRNRAAVNSKILGPADNSCRQIPMTKLLYCEKRQPHRALSAAIAADEPFVEPSRERIAKALKALH